MTSHHLDDMMRDLAKLAVEADVSRSSFEQCAAACYDDVSEAEDDAHLPTAEDVRGLFADSQRKKL